MFWPAVIALMAGVVLAVVTGAAVYVGHRREDTRRPDGTVGVHRAVGVSGRHRLGLDGPVGGSVAGLRARGHADALRMYPCGGGGRR